MDRQKEFVKQAVAWMRNPKDKRTMEDIIKEFGSPELMREWKKPNHIGFLD